MELKRGYYHLLALLVVTIWGTTYVATKELIRNGMTPQEIFLFRFAIAYAGIWLISPKRLFALRWKDELRMAAAGLFGGSLYFFTENTALGITQASNVSFLLCLAPLFTAVLTTAFYREERVTRGLFLGSMLALAGVGMIVFDGSVSLQISPVGDLLTLCAALSWAVYSLIVRKLSVCYPIVFITRKVFFYGILTILPLFLVESLQGNGFELCAPVVWGNLLFLALLASLACFVLWNIVLKKLGTVQASNYIYFSPVATLIVSSIVLGERMTPIGMAGAACILFGVYWAERR